MTSPDPASDPPARPRPPPGPASRPAWLSASAAPGPPWSPRCSGSRPRMTRRAIGKPLGEDAHTADRTYKKKHGRPDRAAAPRGLDRRRAGRRQGQSTRWAPSWLGAPHARAHRSVRLHTAAVVGAETSMLRAQLAGLPPVLPARRRRHRRGRQRRHSPGAHLRSPCVISRTRSPPCSPRRQVVVGTCPDLGALGPCPNPCAASPRAASRQLATAQRDLVLSLGGRVVSLGARGRPLLRDPTRRDVRPRPLPPVQHRLQADGEGDAAQRARRGGSRRHVAVRALRTTVSAQRRPFALPMPPGFPAWAGLPWARLGFAAAFGWPFAGPFARVLGARDLATGAAAG